MAIDPENEFLEIVIRKEVKKHPACAEKGHQHTFTLTGYTCIYRGRHSLLEVGGEG